MIKSLRTIQKYNILSAMSYRTSFLVQVISMLASDIVMLVVFFFFFQKFGTIAGMEFQGYIRLVLIVLVGFCFSSILFAGTRRIGEYIMSGQLDVHLLLPKNVLLRVMMSKIDISVFGDLVYGIGLFFLVKNISFILILKILFGGFRGGITLTAFFLCLESLGFWIGSSKEISRAGFDGVLGPGHYPPNIFHGMFFKILFMSVLPVFFTTYLPYDMIATGFTREKILLLIGGSVVFLTLGVVLFYRGLKRYESGNLMNLNS